MSETTLYVKLSRYLRRLNGCTIAYDCTPYFPTLAEIKQRGVDLKGKSGDALRAASARLVSRARAGETPDALLAEAYSLVSEAVQRTLGLSTFDEQILAAIVLEAAACAEMQTGEGKTLAAVFPAYLNALFGKGVHVLTFNDYLARRDAQWMGPVYRFLGVSAGCVQEGMSIAERKASYGADVTYVTAKEAGFDFLRDSLCSSADGIVHRPLSVAIVDEADSILIDEARVPLVIAGNDPCAGIGNENELFAVAAVARRLVKGRDFQFDEYARTIHLTEEGELNSEALLCCGNLYAEENFEELARLSYALHAQHLLHADEEYIVRNGRIELVDEFTGRVADNRRWPEGLQAAVEAKEGISAMSNGVILNSITLQHFVRLYPKLCGMTATAQAAEEEFRKLYNLRVVAVPPHKPCIRIDHHDMIFSTQQAKHRALVREIVAVHETGRPILVGTRTVRESDDLAADLTRRGVSCSILNAKNDEHEAMIIAEAGAFGSVTISTNMAGRGTDIKLGGATGETRDAVSSLGGLYVIGTNKHESARIDSQLRGRAGRQGDPGCSRFFVSLEDDLFVKYRLRDLLPGGRVRPDESGAIDNPLVRSEINRVQRIIEGQNAEIKTTLLRYSVLLEKQRSILFAKRWGVLASNGALAFLRQRDPACEQRLVQSHGMPGAAALYRNVALPCLDRHWSRHLAQAADIRDGIHLRRIGGQDPLFEFQKLIIGMFDAMAAAIDDEILESCRQIAFGEDQSRAPCAPSATWTYLIKDNPFDPLLEIQFKGNIGLSAWAGLLWPLTGLYFLLRAIAKKRRKEE
jgi:preprotein translocase subunit SecA